MNIALCYESVLPARGGCETYIADLTRRLCADGHEVHLYASCWDDSALPDEVRVHAMPRHRAPRFLRPWLFGHSCMQALARQHHDVTIGFDKTWGQDVLYPQGGLHAASVEHNLRKHQTAAGKWFASIGKRVDPASNSFRLLERRQYCGSLPPIVVVNSGMVREHFRRYYDIASEAIHVVPNGIDPLRFEASNRDCIRREWRKRWNLDDQTTAALFVAMNYRLKGIEPLLHSLRFIPSRLPFRLVVVGSPHVAPFQRLARRLGISDRVVFHGFCAETRSAYFAADFLVHPTFYDPCSLVVLEALACGLPVITSRYNGASELLDPPRAGLVIDDPHDHQLLANSLEQFCDPARRAIAADAARAAARRWTFDHHYQRMMAVFRLAAERRAATSPIPLPQAC